MWWLKDCFYMNTLTYYQLPPFQPQHFIPLTSFLLSIAGKFKSVINIHMQLFAWENNLFSWVDASFRDTQLWNPWGSVVLCAAALWSLGMKSWFQMGIRLKRGEGSRQGDLAIHGNRLWRLRACLLDTMSSSWHQESLGRCQEGWIDCRR